MNANHSLTVAIAGLLFTALTPSARGDATLDALRRRAAEAHGPVLAELRHAADDALARKLLRVTDKTSVPPGGAKRDFFTLAPYYWPNPKTADGLPYVLRDGQVNPETASDKYNRIGYFSMWDTARTLALAYHLTGHEPYAERAALVVRTWFLDPDQGMRPNLNFAQHIRGLPGGRHIGLIRGMTIVELVDEMSWLESSPHWSKADRSAWRDWLGAYSRWLDTSKLGREEAESKNNHGNWYDVQLATAALASDHRDLARRVLADVPGRRFARQLQPDGAQPLELARTKSWDYSIMNLEAMFRLARLGQAVGIDLWNWHDEKGRSLRAALDYLVPAATGERPWTTKQIRPLERAKLYPFLLRAAEVYHEPAYAAAAAKIPDFNPATRREALWALAGLPASP